jgi:hypothetical protein
MLAAWGAAARPTGTLERPNGRGMPTVLLLQYAFFQYIIIILFIRNYSAGIFEKVTKSGNVS